MPTTTDPNSAYLHPDLVAAMLEGHQDEPKTFAAKRQLAMADQLRGGALDNSPGFMAGRVFIGKSPLAAAAQGLEGYVSGRQGEKGEGALTDIAKGRQARTAKWLERWQQPQQTGDPLALADGGEIRPPYGNPTGPWHNFIDEAGRAGDVALTGNPERGYAEGGTVELEPEAEPGMLSKLTSGLKDPKAGQKLGMVSSLAGGMQYHPIEHRQIDPEATAGEQIAGRGMIGGMADGGEAQMRMAQQLRGGRVKGPDRGARADNVTANLTPGEYVLPRKTTQKIGPKKLDKVVEETNDGRKPRGVK